MATGIFSTLGDSKTPFLFLAASSTSNIGMDILFVAAFQMTVAASLSILFYRTGMWREDRRPGAEACEEAEAEV